MAMNLTMVTAMRSFQGRFANILAKNWRGDGCGEGEMAYKKDNAPSIPM